MELCAHQRRSRCASTENRKRNVASVRTGRLVMSRNRDLRRNSTARRWWRWSRSNKAISGPASTTMLGAEDVIQDCLAAAAEIMPATAMFPEQVLAKLVCGRLLGRFTSELFGYRLAHEIGERNAPCIEPRPQGGLELSWQANGDRHGAGRPCITMR